MRDRSSFGYIEPAPVIPNFAQCGSCRLWLYHIHNCRWLSANDEVRNDHSCNIYVQGPQTRDAWAAATGTLAKDEVGFQHGDMRCENCTSFNSEARICYLYSDLNDRFPDLFGLNIKVKPRGRCNAYSG
jgi:hypothetical protein